MPLLTSIITVPSPEQNIDIRDQLLNGDGTPVENAIVNLYREDSKFVSSYTTEENGIYEFNNLIESYYEVQVLYPDERGIEWTQIGTLESDAIAPVTNFDIVPPVLNLVSENDETTVTVETPGTGYNSEDPPIIAADDGYTGIGIVNSSGILTGVSPVIPGDGTATEVNTFNFKNISNLISYQGIQNYNGGESTNVNYDTVALNNIINSWQSTFDPTQPGNYGCAGAPTYITNQGLVKFGPDSAAIFLSLKNDARCQSFFPGYTNLGLYAYPAGQITIQTNTTTLPQAPLAYKILSWNTSGPAYTHSVTLELYNFGLISVADCFTSAPNWPPPNTPPQGVSQEMRYFLNIPPTANINDFTAAVYSVFGIKNSVWDFINAFETYNEAYKLSKQAKVLASKTTVRSDNFFIDFFTKELDTVVDISQGWMSAVRLFTITGPLIDDDIPISIINNLESATSMDTPLSYDSIIYMMGGLSRDAYLSGRWLANFYGITEQKMGQFGCEQISISQKHYKYLNSNSSPTSVNTGILNPNYDPQVTEQVFNEVKGYLGGKYLPLVNSLEIGGVLGTSYSTITQRLQTYDQQLGTSWSQKWVETTSSLADFFHELGQATRSGNIEKNWNDFKQQTTGLESGVAPQYLWGKNYMSPANEPGHAWIHSWNSANGAYTITKVSIAD